SSKLSSTRLSGSASIFAFSYSANLSCFFGKLTFVTIIMVTNEMTINAPMIVPTNFKPFISSRTPLIYKFHTLIMLIVYWTTVIHAMNGYRFLSLSKNSLSLLNFHNIVYLILIIYLGGFKWGRSQLQ